MDTKVLEALKGSIKKWEAIINEDGLDKMGINCPLCQYSWIRGNSLCDSCIISEKTSETNCDGTPHEDWVIHQNTAHDTEVYMKICCPECKMLAEKELAFLKSLLPKEE
jgi:hypothetical protein